jgi:hypothetical protein
MPSRKQTRKNRSQRLRRGGSGYSYVPAPVDYTGGNGMAELNLSQGRQFTNMTKTYHGGSPVGLLGGPYPTALGDTLPKDLIDAARLDPLVKSFADIADLKDPGQAGGKRKSKKSRKTSRKNRKSKKSRKTSRKNRKSKKSRKTSRKNRKSKKSRKNRKSQRRNRRGGGHLGFNSVNAPGMLLKDYSKTGLNPEWNLAKDPNAFAPLAARS